MKIVKTNTDINKTVIKEYKGCGHLEYYGLLYRKGDKQLCRDCIYKEWESIYPWQRSQKDYTFPYYIDGEKYYEKK